MPKKHPTEVRDRATRMALDRLKDYPSISAACRDLAPKLNICHKTLRRWVVQAQVNSGTRTGPSSVELEEIKQLKREVRDLKEANEVLRSASIFLSSGNSTLAATDLPLIDGMRAKGHGVESICEVLRTQGVQIAPRSYRAWKRRPPAERTFPGTVVTYPK